MGRVGQAGTGEKGTDAKEEEKGMLVDDLSKLAHEQWSGWMEYLFSKSTTNPDGTVTIPKWAVDRWKRQVATEYKDLSPEEQASDREEACRVLAIVRVHREKNLI